MVSEERWTDQGDVNCGCRDNFWICICCVSIPGLQLLCSKLHFAVQWMRCGPASTGLVKMLRYRKHILNTATNNVGLLHRFICFIIHYGNINKDTFIMCNALASASSELFNNLINSEPNCYWFLVMCYLDVYDIRQWLTQVYWQVVVSLFIFP